MTSYAADVIYGQERSDPYFGPQTCASLQRTLIRRKNSVGAQYYNGPVNGIFDLDTRKAFQTYLADVAGYSGGIDGRIDGETLMAFCKYLNKINGIGEPDDEHPHDTWYSHWTGLLQASLATHDF